MEQQSDVIDVIENDDFYKYFLQQNKSSLSEYMSISEQVKKLGEGIELITKELQIHVLEKHEDLLKQANHATKLENVLNSMNSHVQNLFANAERLKNQINGPYEALEKHTKVLGRLHLASHILRLVNRIQQLSKRLSNTNDPIQKATILQELEQLASDEDLKDIDAVTSELRNIRTQWQKVMQLATGSLNQGIFNENVTQSSTSLQIFINLGTVNEVIKDLIKSSLDECRHCLNSSFESGNIKAKTGSGRISLASSQGFRGKVWVELEKSFSEEIYQQCKQVKFLQIIMGNMNVSDMDNIAFEFWTNLGNVIQQEINNSSSAVQQMLEEEYPKFLKCYFEMTKKLNYDNFTFNRNILEKCETAYLSSSLTRLLEPTQSMFIAENNTPSHDDIDKIIRAITSDLSVALIEENLCEKISKNISKCMKMFAVKTEQQLETGADSAQVIGGSANSRQRKNVQLANCLYYFQVQIQRLLFNMKGSLTNSKVDLIRVSTADLENLMATIMQPLVVSMNSAIETIIVTIHLETDWSKLQISNSKHISCSPYMRELNQFISRVYSTYLSSFENKDILLGKCGEIALRCIELFVRHTSLLRPISQGGRLRLKADYSHLENSLKVIYPNLTDLGTPYKLLKSMESLINLTPAEIIESHAAGSVVPHSTILMMLFTFAGADLASPHQNTGWSLLKLSAWLDEHPAEADRLDLVAGAIQKYESLVRMTNSVNYDPIYPIMSQFLENAMKNCT